MTVESQRFKAECEARLEAALTAPPKRRTLSTEHLRLKAVAVMADIDLGTFEAVISTESADREKDVVSATGMVAALRQWNRPIPLMWSHGKNAEDVIGSIDAQSARAVNGEVVVGGRVDLNSTVGREAWRSFKSRAIGFSFGYMIVSATKRAGGGRNISELDIFEVSATPTPMNNSTRVVSSKGVAHDAPTLDDLDQKAHDLGLPTRATMRVRTEWHDQIVAALRGDTGDRLTSAALRQKCARVARELGC